MTSLPTSSSSDAIADFLVRFSCTRNRSTDARSTIDTIVIRRDIRFQAAGIARVTLFLNTLSWQYCFFIFLFRLQYSRIILSSNSSRFVRQRRNLCMLSACSEQVYRFFTGCAVLYPPAAPGLTLQIALPLLQGERSGRAL
ncbi:hypothetical protein TKWG_14095 [Advenella kashmirensis WT001]|uniref:Uncharacterized protein n=1 Tax=Advenella kashmirensis (strain DSM 17095 / LMG 22695 / WT001) TaxID=1036672 RepID=I3UD09_ADVKW|nr:hypothetical protein TKWG_14095 [Advenella kashmirensis WT001]